MHQIPPIASTRFQPPAPVGRWVARPRMDKLLDAAGERRLTLIHAPAGFGKSTLASQWMSSMIDRGTRTAWLSLDEDDNGALWFLSHLTECLSHALPYDTHNMLQILEDRPDDAERYLVPLLINQVHEADGRTAIFLDDWHLITDSRTHAVFNRIINYSGDKLSFIVTSRSTAGLPLARLRVQEQLVEVDPQVLRFDQRETRQFLTDIKGIALNSAELSALYNRTEGWIAALQLTSLSLNRNPDLTSFLGNLSSRKNNVGEYLADNVLDLLEPQLLDFLMRTAVVSRITPDLATRLTGRADADLLLEEVLEKDLFLQRLDDVGEWYRYHHLFGNFLRQRLEKTLPDEVADLHSRAAHWFQEQGMLAPAVDHALLAGELCFAIDSVEKESILLVEQSRMASLLALIAKLPQRETAGRPWLHRAISWAYCLLHFPDEANQSLIQLRQAMDSCEELTDAEHFILSRDSRVIEECVKMYRDQVSDDDRLQPEVLDEAARLDPWTVSVAANVRTFNEIDRGHNEKAASLQRWAYQYHRQVKGSFSEVYGECYAGLAALHQLDTPSAKHHWERALLAATERSGRNSHAARIALGLLGKLHYQLGEIDLAETELEESLRIGQRAGVVDFTVPVYESLAFIRAGRGDLDGAELVLEQGEQAGRTLSLTRLWTRMATIRAQFGLPVIRPTPPPAASVRERRFFSDEATRLDLALSIHAHPVPDEEGLIGRAEHLIDTERRHGNRFRAMQDSALLAGAFMARDASQRAEHVLTQVVEDSEQSGLLQSLAITRNFASQADRGAKFRVTPSDESPSTTTENTILPEETPPRRSLNSREREILRLVDAGCTNRQIADLLYLGINTVKWYLRNLYRELEVSSRLDCVRRARDLGELSDETRVPDSRKRAQPAVGIIHR